MNPDQIASGSSPDPAKEQLSRKGLIWFYVIQWIALIIVALALLDSGTYGWTLFGIIPFSIGLTAGTFTKRYRSGKLIRVTLLVILCILGLSAILLLGRAEGIICILMALGVIALPTFIGMAVGMWIRKIHVIYLAVFVVMINASFITFDRYDESQVISITSEEVVIEATKEDVWYVLTHGVQFKPNSNFFFESGVNYPTSMQLQYKDQNNCFLVCTLSAGNTALKVESLDSLKSIRFSVPDMIIPMQELSIYDSIDAPHLQGYFKPVYGEFKIESISDNECRLVATTSYSYKITPVFYWKWWSDYLVNTMHRHVLNDIKLLAEANARDQNR
jgi:hypothetical protein